MKIYLKFGLLIVGDSGNDCCGSRWAGISETKSYYKTIAEVNQLGNGEQGAPVTGQRLCRGSDRAAWPRGALHSDRRTS